MNPKKQKNMEPSSFQHSAGAPSTSINHLSGVIQNLRGPNPRDGYFSANVSIGTDNKALPKTVKVHRNFQNSEKKQITLTISHMGNAKGSPIHQWLIVYMILYELKTHLPNFPVTLLWIEKLHSTTGAIGVLQ